MGARSTQERREQGRLLRQAAKRCAWEREKEFRARVRNAVAWVNANHSAAMKRMLSSMPRRMAAVVEAKGAMTPY